MKFLKKLWINLTCKHMETTTSEKHYEECHGYHLSEYKETCNRCKKIRRFAYGNIDKWHEEVSETSMSDDPSELPF